MQNGTFKNIWRVRFWFHITVVDSMICHIELVFKLMHTPMPQLQFCYID